MPALNTTSRWLVRALIAIGILLVLSPMMCLCPYAQIERERVAEFDDTHHTLLFAASGYYVCLLTAEGPFPHWGRAVKVVLRPDAIGSQNGQQVFQLGSDFSTQYDVAKAGTVTVDWAHRTASLDLEYADPYAWQKLRGQFPMVPRRTR
jgi:hypothetical protein